MLLPFFFVFSLCFLDFASTGVTAFVAIGLSFLIILVSFAKIRIAALLDWSSIYLLLLLSFSVVSYFLFSCASSESCRNADRTLLLLSAPAFVYLCARAISLSSSLKSIFNALLASAYFSVAILLPVQLYQVFTGDYLDVLEPPLLVPVIGILETARLGYFRRPLYFNIRDFGAFACIVSALLSGSRTCIGALLLATLCNYLIVAKSSKKLVIFSPIVAIFAFVGFFVFSREVLDSSKLEFGFLYKVLNSFAEIFWTPDSSSQYEEIGLKWRGFESFIFFSNIQQSDPLAILFGRGLSYALPLPFEMELAGNLFWELPLLHNGFQFVFLKLGFLGFAFVIAFFLFLFFDSRWRSLISAQAFPSSQWWIILFYSSLLASLVVIFIGGGFFQGSSYSLIAVLGFSRFLLSRGLK